MPETDEVLHEKILPPTDPAASRIPNTIRQAIRTAGEREGLWTKFCNYRDSKKRELIGSGTESVPAARIAFWDAYQAVFPQGVTRLVVSRRADSGSSRGDVDGVRGDVEKPTYSFEGLASRVPLDRSATIIDEIEFAATNAFTPWSAIWEHPDLVPSRRALIFLKMARDDVTDFVKNALIKTLLTDRRLEDERRRAVDADIPVLSDLDEAERALLEERQAAEAKAAKEAESNAVVAA